ncbi:MAG: hypothetical protein FWF02_07480 [Micrococcales bacterium]|nr:hypothetical protein [Micrococcales bacterium]MCL2667533.1 hypothetical protein [Micrococcales bacterium]
MNRRWLTVGVVVALTVMLVLYAAVVVVQAVALVRTGNLVAVAFGVVLLVVPLMVVAAVASEWKLAVDTQVMADTLAAADALPVDDLPRGPGGRIDRVAAREAFDVVREATEAEPDDWRSWYHLAFAYDAAGDRSRARQSLRTAAKMRRAELRQGR